MRLGALLTPAGGLNPHHLVEEAKAIEAAGFDSLWSAHAMGRGFMVYAGGPTLEQVRSLV